MNYRFREMTINDINDIVKGEEKVFGHSLGYDLIYSDLTINPYACYIVLEIDGNIHGYFGLWITDNVEIINLYVDEEYQGMGFGSLMMDFIINVCKSSQVNNLSLEVRKSNIKAQKLYEKYGLKQASVRKDYYIDKEKNSKEDAILMVRTFEVDK